MRAVRTYERFERHVRAWAAREVESFLVVGRPGIGKSTCYERALGGRKVLRFGGRMTAFECYCRLHDESYLPVVFDDVGSLLRDRAFVDLMRQLCVMRPHKIISWRTSTPLLKGRKQVFRTVSRALIVLNELPARNEDLRAVLDRLDAIVFEPTKVEVLRKMGEIWPEEGELIDLIAEASVLPSLRDLEKALAWRKSKHLDVIEELLAECGVPVPIQQLVNIMRTEPEEQWCTRYMELTGRSARSFRRHKKMAERLLVRGRGGQTDTTSETHVA